MAAGGERQGGAGKAGLHTFSPESESLGSSCGTMVGGAGGSKTRPAVEQWWAVLAGARQGQLWSNGGRCWRQQNKASCGAMVDGAGGSKTRPTVEREASPSEHTAATAKPGTCLVSIGPGLPSLPKRLVERICMGEYVDFGEFPPVKGKSRLLPQAGGGTRHCPDGHPQDDTGLGYLAAVFRHIYSSGGSSTAQEGAGTDGLPGHPSQTYHWPPWVVDDQAFRQEMAGAVLGQGRLLLVFSVFLRPNMNAENWCSVCRSLDHTASAVKDDKETHVARVTGKRSKPGGVPEIQQV